MDMFFNGMRESRRRRHGESVKNPDTFSGGFAAAGPAETKIRV
jgi:hypothetical protein